MIYGLKKKKLRTTDLMLEVVDTELLCAGGVDTLHFSVCGAQVQLVSPPSR